MGSSINSANVLLTIEPKTTMEVMILATGDTQRRVPERLEWAVQEVASKTKTSGTESSQLFFTTKQDSFDLKFYQEFDSYYCRSDIDFLE